MSYVQTKQSPAKWVLWALKDNWYCLRYRQLLHACLVCPGQVTKAACFTVSKQKCISAAAAWCWWSCDLQHQSHVASLWQMTIISCLTSVFLRSSEPSVFKFENVPFSVSKRNALCLFMKKFVLPLYVCMFEVWSKAYSTYLGIVKP